MGNNEKKQSNIEKSADSLVDIIEILNKDNTEIVIISNHIILMSESLQGALLSLSNMEINLKNIAQRIKEIASAEAGMPDPDPEKAEPVPVHRTAPLAVDRIVLCGALGTVQQPFYPPSGYGKTNVDSDVNCPECLEIMAAEEKS